MVEANRTQEQSKVYMTVAVIAYNAERTLRACLEAIFNQNCQRELYEVILVDSGSTDSTIEIAREFPVRIFVEKGCTRGRARNICLREAYGEIVVMVDSDVICPRDWLSKAIDAFKDPTVAAISGRYVTPKPELGLISSVIYYLTSGREEESDMSISATTAA